MNKNLEAEEIVVEVKKNKPPKNHKLKVVNGQVVCVSCDCNHTVNIDPEKVDVVKFN